MGFLNIDSRKKSAKTFLDHNGLKKIKSRKILRPYIFFDIFRILSGIFKAIANV